MRSLDEVYMRSSELAKPFPFEQPGYGLGFVCTCLSLFLDMGFSLRVFLLPSLGWPNRFQLQADNTVKDSCLNFDQYFFLPPTCNKKRGE